MSDVPSHEQPPGAGQNFPARPPAGSQDETERAVSTRPLAQPPPARPARPRPEDAAQRRRQSVSQQRVPQRGYPPGTAAPPPPGYAVPVQDQPYPARPARRPRAVPPSESGLYLPWWSLILLVGVVGMIAFGLLLAFSALSQPATPGNQPPRVQVLTAQPTLSENFTGQSGVSQPLWTTPIPVALPTATAPLPTPAPSPTLPPGQFGIGVTVQVVGVGLNGLKVRDAPGYDGTLRFLAAEGDTFVIVDGPQSADDIEWWRLEDPNDSSRYGWAARNFLMAAAQ